MQDRLDAWNDGAAICVIAMGSHGDPLDLAEHEVRSFVQRLEQCLSVLEELPRRTEAAGSLQEARAVTLRHLAACRYYLPAVLRTPAALEAERAWSEYLHHNELGLALDEAETMRLEEVAPGAYWRELVLAAQSMNLEAAAARLLAHSAA